jgi:putative Mg2+ transporter-C (MgtC) family protein
MDPSHLRAFSLDYGQGSHQVMLLLLAFALSSVVGLERQLSRKSAGLRTQAIVGTASALYLLVGKYGFADVMGSGVHIDPSRVAAQVVSGLGFLGAGLIMTRQGTVRGLTTAAAVWEAAAIGMAAGAGLVLLAVSVTVLHFVIVLGYTPLVRRLPGEHRVVGYRVVYEDGRGVLREMLSRCTDNALSVTSLTVSAALADGFPAAITGSVRSDRQVCMAIELTGPRADGAADVLGGVEGVLHIDRVDEDGED